MMAESLRQLVKSLHKSKFLVTKPSFDVFQGIQAFIVLVKGVKTNDWLVAQSIMCNSLNQMIESVIKRDIDTQNIFQCKKLLQHIPVTQTLLGKSINQLNETSLKYLEIELNKLKRSKSSILPRGQYPHDMLNKSNNNTHHKKQPIPFQATNTKIGNLVKSYKQDIQKMLDNRRTIKKSFVQERTNRNVEQLKEHMKKVNKYSYFISPRKLQHDQQQCLSQERKPHKIYVNSNQARSLRQFRKSFLQD